MLYLLHGTDQKKAREKLHKLVDSLHAKKPDAALFILDTDNFSEAKIDELVGGQGLFSNKYIVVLDKLLEDKSANGSVLEKIKEIATSENIFIAIEEKLDKKTLTKLEKNSEKVLNFDSKEKKSTRTFGTDNGPISLGEFNIFNIADAFASRDKKKLWSQLQESQMHNIPPEEVHGIIMWSVRSMLLASAAKSASESGLKPFVFNKSKRNAGNFKEGELQKISSDLVSVYHDARRGIVGMDIGLEQFVLSI
ncbi:hypothetical protein ACFLY0_00185 [Patescibacteria group bacterium]